MIRNSLTAVEAVFHTLSQFVLPLTLSHDKNKWMFLLFRLDFDSTLSPRSSMSTFQSTGQSRTILPSPHNHDRVYGHYAGREETSS